MKRKGVSVLHEFLVWSKETKWLNNHLSVDSLELMWWLVGMYSMVFSQLLIVKQSKLASNIRSVNILFLVVGISGFIIASSKWYAPFSTRDIIICIYILNFSQNLLSDCFLFLLRFTYVCYYNVLVTFAIFHHTFFW
jgi:hypothetical protein